jgi:hypothetical protein
MRNIRKADRSIHYYIKNALINIWGATINVIDGFPDNYINVSLPTVSIDYISSVRPPLEIGTEETDDSMFVEIDIFARGKGERDDLLDVICDLLISGCTMYTFSGETPQTTIGRIDFDFVSAKPVYLFGEGEPPSSINGSVTATANLTFND